MISLKKSRNLHYGVTFVFASLLSYCIYITDNTSVSAFAFNIRPTSLRSMNSSNKKSIIQSLSVSRGTTSSTRSATSTIYLAQNDYQNQKQNLNDSSTGRSSNDLPSLLDEAVLLHSKIGSSPSFPSDDQVQSLIEEIAIAMQMEMKIPEQQLAAASNSPMVNTSAETKKGKRTMEEVKFELDKAVVHLQKLAFDDEEEKWTKVIEELAIEYHELSSSIVMSHGNDDNSDNYDDANDVSLLSSLSSLNNSNHLEGQKIVQVPFEEVIDKLKSKLDMYKKGIYGNDNDMDMDIHTKDDTANYNSDHENENENEKVFTTMSEIGSKGKDEKKGEGEEELIKFSKKVQLEPQSSSSTSTKDIEPKDEITPSSKQTSNQASPFIPISFYVTSDDDIDDDDDDDDKLKKSSTLTSSKNEMVMNDDINSSTKNNGNEEDGMKPITSTASSSKPKTNVNNKIEAKENDVEEVDVVIIGAGIGGLCAGAILNTLYGKKVGIYESHYLPGGCAHAFPATAVIDKGTKKEKVPFTFDSGPTIVLGCSTKPYNPLRQVLNAVGMSDEVEWIPYQGWGMVENPLKEGKEIRWQVDLGPELFEKGPLLEFGGEEGVEEFQQLREITKVLVSGAVEIPAMAMRAGNSALIPLLRYLPALSGLISQGEEVTQGTFGQFMDGPKFVVKSQWLRDWLDALAFSLSGLPACRTSAAAMAYVIYDMHREGAALDYPKGGLGSVIDALVKGVEQGSHGSGVHLRQHVQSIDTSPDGSFIKGITLKNGKEIIAKDGVICNAPVWSLNDLVKNDQARKVLNNFLPVKKERTPRQTWTVSNDGNPSEIRYTRPQVDEDDDSSLLAKCDTAEMTGSFLHLHLALDATDIDLDTLHAHYTVMDRGIGGDGSVVNGYKDSPCGELNMIAVSNPCVLDRTLAPEGYIVVHAYGAGNEPYDIWKGLDRNSQEYKALKELRAQALWRAVESIIPDARDRVVTSMIGSPITHERFLRRPRGTYGASTEDYLKDGSTPFERLVLCGDGVFPGIGIPAVALSGASAANTMISPWKQWKCLDKLKSQKLI